MAKLQKRQWERHFEIYLLSSVYWIQDIVWTSSLLNRLTDFRSGNIGNIILIIPEKYHDAIA